MLNRRPGGSAFCWVLAFSTTSCHQRVSKLTGCPEGPFGRVWLSLPHLVSNSSVLQLPDFLSSPSYIIVQSPTQSLEWHVWSSSSGNNCHAVQRSLSSGASVYEYIMGFYLVPFRQPNPPTRFLSITGHWDVLLPSVASLWNGMFCRAEGQHIAILHISQSSMVGALSSDSLMSYQDTRWGFLHLCRDTVYSTAPADWAQQI